MQRSSSFSSPSTPKPRSQLQFVTPEYSQCKQEFDEYAELEKPDNHQLIQRKIQNVNQWLSKYCSWQIPNLNSINYEIKNGVVEIVSWLVQELQKKQQYEQKMNSYRRKTDQFLLQREQMLQKIARQQKSIQNQKQLLQAKKQNMERLHKQSIQRVTNERDDYLKQLKKIQARQKTIEAEFRKKDNQIKYLQDTIKKIQQKNQSKTHLRFEVVEGMQQNRVVNFGNGNHKTKNQDNDAKREYELLALSRFQQTLKDITSQNVGLKEYISRLTEKMQSIFNVVNQRENNCTILSQESLSKLKTPKIQVINQPYKFSKPKLEQLLENLQKVYNHIINLHDQSQQLFPIKQEEHKYQEEQKMRNLIQNFKQIIKSQDQILCKIIERSQNPTRTPNTQSHKYSYHSINPEKETEHEEDCKYAVERCQFNKIHDFIQGHLTRIENKNKELAQTKQKLVEGIGITERIKREICRQRDIAFGLNF